MRSHNKFGPDSAILDTNGRTDRHTDKYIDAASVAIFFPENRFYKSLIFCKSDLRITESKTEIDRIAVC